MTAMPRSVPRLVPPTPAPLTSEDQWQIYWVIAQKAVELEVLADRADANPMTSRAFALSIRRDAVHYRVLAERFMGSRRGK